MELHQLELSVPLRGGNLAGDAHNVVMRGMEQGAVRPLFFVVSARHIVVQAGEGAFNPRLLGARLREVRRKPYRPEVREGQVMNFRLRMNTERRFGHGESHASRAGAATDAQIMDRLLTLAERAGFEVGEDTFFERESDQTLKRGDLTVRLRSALVQGRLRVVDAERFQAALESGIGRKRTYGFGLLQVY